MKGNLIIVLWLLFIADNAYAQVMWTNCVDASGRQVAFRETPGTNNFYAKLEGGYPVILWDPVFASQLSPETQTFFYAHECAHHVLGHSYGNIPTTREKEADCWAINTLVSRGILDRKDLRRVQYEISLFPGDWWIYLPGPQRALSFEHCLSAAGIEPVDREEYCETVRVSEDYTDYEIINRPLQVPCNHCRCDARGYCGCMHAFDFVDNYIRTPVRKTRYVNKTVCN